VCGRGGPAIVVSVFAVSDSAATGWNLVYTHVSDEPFLYTVYLSRYYIKIIPSIDYSINYNKFHTHIHIVTVNFLTHTMHLILVGVYQFSKKILTFKEMFGIGFYLNFQHNVRPSRTQIQTTFF
jgi:hypothetical protein